MRTGRVVGQARLDRAPGGHGHRWAELARVERPSKSWLGTTERAALGPGPAVVGGGRWPSLRCGGEEED